MNNDIMNEEYLAKLQTVFEDEEFVASLKGVTDMEKIKACFEAKDIILTQDIVDAIIPKLKYYQETGELDAETLEVVSGGRYSFILGTIFLGAAYGVSAGGPLGAVAGAVIGAVAGVYIQSVNDSKHK